MMLTRNGDRITQTDADRHKFSDEDEEAASAAPAATDRFWAKYQALLTPAEYEATR